MQTDATHPANTAFAQQLEQVLAHLQEKLSTLVPLLQNVGFCLSKGNVDELQPLLEQETGLMNDLANLGEQQNQLLKSNGFTTNAQGMEQALTQHNASATVRNLWQKIKKDLQNSRLQNQANSRLVNQSQSRVAASLNILRGSTADSGAKAYDANGKLKADTYQQKLADV